MYDNFEYKSRIENFGKTEFQLMLTDSSGANPSIILNKSFPTELVDENFLNASALADLESWNAMIEVIE